MGDAFANDAFAKMFAKFSFFLLLFSRIFREFRNFKILDQAGASVFINKSSKSELSSRFFGRLKITKKLTDYDKI